MFVDPYSPEGLAESITILLENEPLRKRFIHLGFSRVAGFSWEKTAETTLQLFYSFL